MRAWSISPARAYNSWWQFRSDAWSRLEETSGRGRSTVTTPRRLPRLRPQADRDSHRGSRVPARERRAQPGLLRANSVKGPSLFQQEQWGAPHHIGPPAAPARQRGGGAPAVLVWTV